MMIHMMTTTLFRAIAKYKKDTIAKRVNSYYNQIITSATISKCLIAGIGSDTVLESMSMEREEKTRAKLVSLHVKSYTIFGQREKSYV